MAPAPYDINTKARVLKQSEGYETTAEAARNLGVSIRTLGRWKQGEGKPTGKRYTEEDRKNYAAQAQNYSTWKEASSALGPDYKSLMAWCKKYHYPFPEKKEIKNQELPTERVKTQRIPKKKIKKTPISPSKIELSEDIKEGISNMLADNVSEKVISRLTRIPKAELREVINTIRCGGRT